MFRNLALFALLASPIESFAVTGTGPSNTNLAASVSTSDDLLKPSYDIEPISIRIGHGFDIHRMVPIGDAGQPLIIGGVEITHKDQKVCDPMFHRMKQKRRLSSNDIINHSGQIRMENMLKLVEFTKPN